VRRRLAVLTGALTVLGGLGLVLVPARAAGPAFVAYGADAGGTAVHSLGGSNAFPNFRTGAVDNSYPLATAHLDASPAAQATASLADTGPLGATGASQAGGAQQPQYAVATYPGQGSASLSAGASVAEAAATETSADSVGSVGAAGSTVEQPGDPAHTSADHGDAHVVIDRAKGLVSARSIGHVGRASFAAGALVIGDVDVTASVTSDGTTATPAVHVAVGSAAVNGTPVEITDKGVVVADAPQPGSDAVTATVNGQLNQALAAAGVKVFATAPEVLVEGARGSVSATGVHVIVTPASPDPSVPTVSVEYILGEARAFAFAEPGEPTGETVATPAQTLGDDLTAPDSFDAGVPSGVTSAGAVQLPRPTRPVGSGGQLGTQPASVFGHRDKPTWLVVLFLVWQGLMVVTTGLVLWTRRMVTA
jgi:hypothetical protein